MAIKGNQSTALIAATAADFTIFQNTTSGRVAFTQIHLHEFGNTGDTVELFRSADATSAAGERIDQVVLAANESEFSSAATVVIEPGEFLVGNAVTGALVNVQGIYTQYSGSD